MKPVVLEAGAVDVILSPDVSWIDSELQIDCRFGLTEDGVERCLPYTIAYATYSDANCTLPVTYAPWPSSCGIAPLPYVGGVASTPEGCSASSVFRVTGTAPLPAELYTDVSGTCEPQPTDSAAFDTIYELEPVPPETFVAVTTAKRSRHPDMDAFVREGEDGSWQVVEFFDPERQAACLSRQPGLLPAMKCIPSGLVYAEGFLDATCQTAAARVDVCEGEVTAFVDLGEPVGTCPSTQTLDLHEVAETREASIDYFESDGMCMNSPTEQLEVHVRGAATDPSTLPDLELVMLGEARVRATFLGFDGVAFTPLQWGEGSLYDAMAGEPCSALDFSDGSMRCVPLSYRPVRAELVYFTSASCTGTRLVAVSSECPVPSWSGFAVYEADTSVCTRPAIAEVVANAGSMTPTQLYGFDRAGACVSVPLDSSATYLVLGEPVNPVELFAEIERAIRN